MALYELLLPKMGESVAEATIIKWQKNVGDKIDVDDSVLEIATKRFPFQGGIVKGSFSLPSFYENFDVVNGIIHPEYKNQLLEIVNSTEF